MSPRLLVEVRGGRSDGVKIALEPGAVRRFGRTELSDVVVPGDARMSGVHFELSWDGAHALLRDRGSTTGTLVGGRPVVVAEVEHGGWIRAGSTDFVARIEAGTPARTESAPSDEGPRRAALAALRAEAERAPLYALLDAARSARIVEILRESVEPHRSLYEGLEGDALAEVAPYLAGPARADSTLLDRLVLEGWGKRWGLYLTSSASLRDLRRHLRRFLVVELETTNRRVYFRYYDPHVMALWASSWNEAQRRAMGACVDSIRLEDAGALRVLAGLGEAIDRGAPPPEG